MLLHRSPESTLDHSKSFLDVIEYCRGIGYFSESVVGLYTGQMLELILFLFDTFRFGNEDNIDFADENGDDGFKGDARSELGKNNKCPSVENTA